MVHKDFRFRFTIKGEWFEAVGFLKNGEEITNVSEMFVRTDAENGGPIGDDSYDFLWENRVDLPVDLEGHLLHTRRQDPNSPRCYSYLLKGENEWLTRWCRLNDGVKEMSLMIRRCPPPPRR